MNNQSHEKTKPIQNALTYPLAQSSGEPDIFAAARLRAQYWGYNPAGRYTVPVELPKIPLSGRPSRSGKIVEVLHEGGGIFRVLDS